MLLVGLLNEVLSSSRSKALRGVEVLQSPRAVLRKQIAEIKKRGYAAGTCLVANPSGFTVTN